MSGSDQAREHAIRERAYFIWEREGRPKGRAHDHWLSATIEDARCQDELMDDEEKVLARTCKAGDARSLLTGWVRLIRTPGCAVGSANRSRELVCAVANAVPMRVAQVTPG